jgi:hypothetical protein
MELLGQWRFHDSGLAWNAYPELEHGDLLATAISLVFQANSVTQFGTIADFRAKREFGVGIPCGRECFRHVSVFKQCQSRSVNAFPRV